MSLYSGAYANENKTTLPRHYKPSTTITGTLGVNTIPSARMDEKGTARIGIGYSDPYAHGFIGFQFTESFYAGLRQTAEISSYSDSADALLPGLDMKLRLIQETANRPALAIGFESAVGHQQMASEYITLSKRYKNFDFTGGLAWGRLGNAAHIKNPLSVFSPFDKERQYDPNGNHGIRDWFTGKNIGFFGGVEYYTPLNGLSVNADYGADDYPSARLINGFNTPPPWAISLNYKPWNPLDLSVGVIGGGKIMARFSLQDKIQHWPRQPAKKHDSAPLRSPRPTDRKINKGPTDVSLSAYQPVAHQIGRSARLHADKMKEDQEEIIIKLHHKGLKGPTITLIRSDLEKALLNNQGTPEEIWQDTTIEKNNDGIFSFKQAKKKKFFRFILHNQVSLTQLDTGPLYRTSLLTEIERPMKYGFLIGGRGRINIADNLKRLRKVQTPQTFNLRSDEEFFAAQPVSIDRFYTGWLHSFSSNTHIALTGGYLEEMFSAYGGEILYRPFDKNYAIGADAFRAQKRQPGTALGVQNINDDLTTAHLNLYYEVPNQDMTFYAKAGRFLVGDYGATIGLQTQFDNGAKLEGFITQTNKDDITVLGNISDTFGGIKLTLPFGNIPYIPDGSAIEISALPFSRGTGQALDRPLQLYEVTEPISFRQIQKSWNHLLD